MSPKPSTNSQFLFNIIHNRRSIRQFLAKEISQNILEKIMVAGFRAPFAAQLCSIIYTRDPKKMAKLHPMGVYPTTQVLMIFLVDIRRLEKIMEQRTHSYNFDDYFALWLGTQDVTLVAENIILAAEALGLGSVLLGATPHFADQLAEIFKIPKRVFPVVGLCLGYPDSNEYTDIRPRFPLQFSAFKEVYYDHTSADIQACMKVMDEGYLAQNYYLYRKAKIPLRTGKDKIGYSTYSWCEHISRKFSQGKVAEHSILDILREQGFQIQ